jgi:hypothetical protein
MAAGDTGPNVKYRKKVVIIDAVQWNGMPEADGSPEAEDKINELRKLLDQLTAEAGGMCYPISGGGLSIQLPGGRTEVAELSDYICRGPTGSVYVRKGSDFESTYELIPSKPTK